MQDFEAKRAKVLELGSYLENGSYRFSTDLRVMYKETMKESPILSSFEPDTQSIHINDDRPKLFTGTILWYCSNGDIKLFSETETLILCANKENYSRKINNQAHFAPHFRTPKLLQQDDKALLLVEEFVPFRPKKAQDHSFILSTIYEDYTRYFTEMKHQSKVTYRTMNELLQTSPHALYLQDYQQIVTEIDRALFDVKFPFLKLHGDLWTDNLLLGSEGLWYIDWDESAEYIFFYDFFKLIWNELDVHQDTSFYDSYINGQFDSQLERIFNLFGMDYQPELKQSYFCLFFLNYILNDKSLMTYELKRVELADFKRKVLSGW
ncbi:hypothetical protein JOC54_000139 [Alkalihalobacillus xiaoxiensis]|uniref:Aminoglycoside phosphotransferase domain-containing protein n=1 Tax=Shouchella xiaoxiensis TaxID=766895 RepID=A0ABS2SN18_9BACI|nr:phosphotransferase [Shouchella xiaoxiensis]MBM7836908.1 hypothetical protein [Shouchella xiaoxiensis]